MKALTGLLFSFRADFVGIAMAESMSIARPTEPLTAL
jgi:hypothetical protein